MKNNEIASPAYYAEVKGKYQALRAALDYVHAACKADLAEWRASIETLAGQMFPDYDGDFFHHYYDEDVMGSDVEEEKEDFFVDCKDAYESARSRISDLISERDILDRHQEMLDPIVFQLRDLADMVLDGPIKGYWKNEKWQHDLKLWTRHD